VTFSRAVHKLDRVLNYNIHGVLGLRVSLVQGSLVSRLGSLRYASFRGPFPTGVRSLTFKCGPFERDAGGCWVIDRRYFVRENYFYSEDREGCCSWRIELDGLDNDHTTINFHLVNPGRGYRRIYREAFLPGAVLLSAINRKLFQAGLFLAHAGAIVRGGKAYVLAGRAGCFKTSLCVDLVRHFGFRWLGDDRVLLAQQGDVWSFPNFGAVFDYMVDHLADETQWGLGARLRFLVNWWRRRGDDAPSRHEARTGRLAGLFLLNRSSENGFTVSPAVDAGRVARALVVSNLLEEFKGLEGLGLSTGPFYRYLTAYSLVYPGSPAACFEAAAERMLREIVGGIPVLEVTLPYRYSLATAEKLHALLETL